MGRQSRTKDGRSRTTRIRNGVTEFLYGGYVNWLNRQEELETREVRIWGPTIWDPDRYGDGMAIMEAIQKKARKKWPKAECREVWRY